MKCTNNLKKKHLLILSFSVLACVLTGCGKDAFVMPFSTYLKEETAQITDSFDETKLVGFADDLAVATGDNLDKYELKKGASGILVDINKGETVFSQNVFQRMYPASLTKIMTAYVACKYCKSDDIIKCTANVSNLGFDDAVAMGLKEGDTLTFDQALHLSVAASYNDAAVAIAEHVSGSVEAFADLMNEEAKKLGATDSHFTNPHGLPDDNHYTTAYDLYLIFNAAFSNPTILEIVQCKQYQTTYYDKNGKERGVSATNTNQYFKGTYALPESVSIVGGKTGTTDEAGYCLSLYVRDKYSNPYIAVILGSDSRDNLYKEMTELLTALAN